MDLPELEEVDGLAGGAGTCELSFHDRVLDIADDAPDGTSSVTANGHCALIRAGAAFVCHFPGLADFRLTSRGLVDIHPAPGTSAQRLRHLLLDHVLPRLLAHQGRLVAHAAAVRVGDGAIAFLGPSGMGKSTLTASFLTDGFPVESDDAVVLSLAQSHVMALSTYRTLRLWPASVDGLYAEPPELAPVAYGYQKRRLVLPTGDLTGLPLSALFVLALSDRNRQDDVSLRRLTAHEACLAVIENAFQLDASDSHSASTLFAAAASVASRVPMYRLAYPRSFAFLPSVRAALLQQLTTDARRHPQDAP